MVMVLPPIATAGRTVGHEGLALQDLGAWCSSPGGADALELYDIITSPALPLPLIPWPASAERRVT